jgi:ribosomal protein L40E
MRRMIRFLGSLFGLPDRNSMAREKLRAMEARLEESRKPMPPEKLVCVKCGARWGNSLNRCKQCRGFCSWGRRKGGAPSSWDVQPDGRWTPKKVVEERP